MKRNENRHSQILQRIVCCGKIRTLKRNGRNDMKKHAYLIMAHTQPELLKKLVMLLDDERNDFYIHVDSKAKDYPLEEILSCVKHANCICDIIFVLYYITIAKKRNFN